MLPNNGHVAGPFTFGHTALTAQAVHAGRGRNTSNLIWAPVTKQWAVTLSVPVRVPTVAGEVKYALSIAVPATQLQKLVSDLPQGWIAAITDRDGKILARSLGHDEWVGKPMARTGWEITKDVPPGQGGPWRDVTTLEGTKVVGAYLRMASTGWLIGISALPEVYQAPRRHTLVLGSTLAVVSLLLATLLAFLMGRRITKAIQVLQVKASAMRDMKVIDFPRTSLQEVNTVAEIMRDTARVLRTRQEQQTTLMQELNHRVKHSRDDPVDQPHDTQDLQGHGGLRTGLLGSIHGPLDHPQSSHGIGVVRGSNSTNCCLPN